jgi:hypothetical protein
MKERSIEFELGNNRCRRAGRIDRSSVPPALFDEQKERKEKERKREAATWVLLVSF